MSCEFCVDEKNYISTWKTIASDILEDSAESDDQYDFSERVRLGKIDILTKEGFEKISPRLRAIANWAVDELKKYPYTFKSENFWFTRS